MSTLVSFRPAGQAGRLRRWYPPRLGFAGRPGEDLFDPGQEPVEVEVTADCLGTPAADRLEVDAGRRGFRRTCGRIPRWCGDLEAVDAVDEPLAVAADGGHHRDATARCRLERRERARLAKPRGEGEDVVVLIGGDQLGLLQAPRRATRPLEVIGLDQVAVKAVVDLAEDVEREVLAPWSRKVAAALMSRSIPLS